MADKGGKRTQASAELPLPLDLPSTMFSGPGLLQLADLLPVMTAYEIGRAHV